MRREENEGRRDAKCMWQCRGKSGPTGREKQVGLQHNSSMSRGWLQRGQEPSLDTRMSMRGQMVQGMHKDGCVVGRDMHTRKDHQE